MPRQRAQQSELREHAALESTQGADSVAGEGDGDESAGTAAAVGAAHVGTEGRLAVGARAHELEPLARAEQDGEEAGYHLARTATMKNVHALKASKMAYEQFQAYLAGTTHPRPVMLLAEVAHMAVFMALGRASG